MKYIILSVLTLLCLSPVLGQHNFEAKITDSKTNEPLIGATAIIQGTNKGATADVAGLVEIKDLPEGNHIIEFRFVGYLPKMDTFYLPQASDEVINISLEEDHEEMEEVIITATRSSRTIADSPTRVEAISGEELEEKGNMKPGDIRMMLNESTGIQTQQTSATSYNSSIRIQGLDGKYTQILRDGLPLYAGFSGGLSLLQIAPLDLRQVEVIKGASSTLYGGGAIAGLVNLVSKTPGQERDLDFMINGTSALGLDVSTFYSERFGKLGATVFASYNMGSAYDPSNTGLTAIPEFERFTLNPRLFVYLNDKTSFNLGFNATVEERIGGDMRYFEDNAATNLYYEKNETDRLSTQFILEHKLQENAKITVKNSVSYYDRRIEIPDYQFSGLQLSSFSEAAYTLKKERSEWVGGLNLWTDEFKQENIAQEEAVDYQLITFGAFAQNTWDISDQFVLESGIRTDYQNEYGFFVLPRISALYKINKNITTRLGGGLGYKTPNVFTEDAERLQFRNVLPVNASATEAERSAGANFDINYRTELSEKSTFSLNTLFFYTQINNPIVLESLSNGYYQYQQPEGYIDTKGIETNAKITYSDFKLFVGYTLADVKEHYNDEVTEFPLVAKHRLNNVLMYEVEESVKIGLEAYYFGPQKLNDGAIGQEYWIFGLMTEKLWENFSIFLNFENFLDARQTRFDTIYTGSIEDPSFRDIYAPVDGFVVNGGIKIKL
ncbi:TonB-dependent receptor [Marivirga sp. S37H4]|uniref:TonB-dependent receptor n=1 Tax=Marivirga aurantiaca TaxID=2802615 RepID=A0A935CDN6_9BACT|nr:TonB-dependent receptor [Marivirga aurantiaca]MBK6267103.1 TonB-dependent receptor [Marivirga aurantiaca]